jgi:N-acetyl sugar amidotransferase
MSNQKLLSRPEHEVKPEDPIPHNVITDGLCDACREVEARDSIDWDTRLTELEMLCDRHRRDDGRYDCIIPGSGGKDSMKQSRVLTEEFGMHPLLVTWPPLLYTEYGWRNYKRWTAKHPSVVYKPSDEVHALLTRLATENLLSPFQPFYFGQKNAGPNTAVRYDVPLVFYGEPESLYQTNTQSTGALRDAAFFTYRNRAELHFGGVDYWTLIEEHGLSKSDLAPYLPALPSDIERVGVEVHYLGYYMPWVPQESYYDACEHYGFEARPFRTEGTYSRYNSIDDHAEGPNHYALYCKTGIGRASYDASQEIRYGHIDREEALALVARYDHETPKRDLEAFLPFIGMSEDRFFELCREARPEHLFDEEGHLRHPVWR